MSRKQYLSPHRWVIERPVGRGLSKRRGMKTVSRHKTLTAAKAMMARRNEPDHKARRLTHKERARG